MGKLLRRRGLMAEAHPAPLPEWDYEWSSSSGSAPTGWTKTTSGTTTTKVASGYWQIIVSTQNGYVQYAWPDTYSKGVIQVSFRFNSNYGNLRVYLSNGTNAIGVRATYSNSSGGKKALLLNDASTVANMTTVGSFTKAKTYNLRLELDSGYADVYWRNYSDGEDWQLVASHVDITTTTNSSPLNMTTLRFTSAASNGTNSTWYLYNIKMKFGRT